MNRRTTLLLSVLLLPTLAFADTPRPRLVIAHHMNAELPGKAGGQDALSHGSNTPTYRPEWAELGGRLRDMSITTLDPAFKHQSLQAQAAWEIKVAKRAGVDAFAFYGALPQREAHVLAYMKAAQGTGFKITLCQSGGERGSKYADATQSLKRLVREDENINSLLRIDGKLLLLTYGGNWGENVTEMVAKRHDLEARVGTPMLVMYAPFPLTPAGHIRNNPKKIAEIYAAERTRITELLQGGFDGLSPFMVVPGERSEADCRFWMDLCKAHGKHYYQPICFQFHSPKHMTHAPVGDAMWRRGWDVAGDGADGVQLVTWNDWGETTAMSPGVNSNYGLHELLRQATMRFKTPNTPAPAEDKAWVMYYRYPSDAQPKLYPPASPRKFRTAEHDHIWVRTALTAPATVVCEGRGEQSVPAGETLTAFPLTPGPVRIVIQRDGEVLQTLSPPEAVTDQPWRVDHALVLFSSDDAERAYRASDFRDMTPRFYSEYGDDDRDGLLNWFEGLYFSVLEAPATQAGADDNFSGIPCSTAQAGWLSPLPVEQPAALTSPVTLDLTSADAPLANAVWRHRYRWDAPTWTPSSDGLILANNGDRHTRERFAFYDAVPNATYGPLSGWGDVQVDADIQFNFGGKNTSRWGDPSFALLSRVSPARASMAFFKIAVDGDRAKLTLGLRDRIKWQPARDQVLAEASLPLPKDHAFTLSLAAETLADNRVRLTGRCHGPAGAAPQVVTAELPAQQKSLPAFGEVGFSARLHEFKDTPAAPHHILLKRMSVSPISSSATPE